MKAPLYSLKGWLSNSTQQIGRRQRDPESRRCVGLDHTAALQGLEEKYRLAVTSSNPSYPFIDGAIYEVHDD